MTYNEYCESLNVSNMDYTAMLMEVMQCERLYILYRIENTHDNHNKMISKLLDMTAWVDMGIKMGNNK